MIHLKGSINSVLEKSNDCRDRNEILIKAKEKMNSLHYVQVM